MNTPSEMIHTLGKILRGKVAEKWCRGGSEAARWQEGGMRVVSEWANGRVAFEWFVSGIQSGKKMAEWLLGGNKMALSERHLSDIEVASKVAKKWRSGFWVATRWYCQRGI